jgi:hypothetical protein
MANTPTRMQQIRLILQAHSQGQKIRAIARQMELSRNTVKDYLRRCLAFEADVRVLLSMSDEELSNIAYQQASVEAPNERRADFERRAKDWLVELGKVGVTRQMLWTVTNHEKCTSKLHEKCTTEIKVRRCY